MKSIYVKETDETCDFIKRFLLEIKKIFNIVKVDNNTNKIIYNIPIFKDNKTSKYRIKKLSNKINKLLERDGSNTIVLSENLGNNQLLKNYLFAQNINILDGRYLFKCLTYKVLEYIFKIRKKKMELRRNYYINK